MNFKQTFLTITVSALTTLGVVWGYGNYQKQSELVGGQPATMPSNYKYAGFTDGVLPPGTPVDFTAASESAIPTVVHIKTKTNARQVTNSTPRSQQRNDPFSDMFDEDMLNQLFGGGRGGMTREQRASGSGVIIAENGYIVTNNHVVANADEVMVTLSNKKSYTAKVVGSDPAYDLAVIKIEAAGLPYLVYGNSDDVRVGQWVLAIGYPLNLETTVTAGIVSAKARSLGLNRDKSGSPSGAVESFIQTDAAVNQGNSGGALINTEGKLIGINSAIASPTGYYSGYSYAIPVNIAKKVVDDIIKFGTVQRGYLGIAYAPASDMTAEEKSRQGIPPNAFGIYVSEVPKDGGAYEAGIRKGDIIKSIAGVTVGSGAQMLELVSRYKPGDKVQVIIIRDEQERTVSVALRNKAGNYDVVKAETTLDLLGGEFATLDAAKAKDFGIDGGVVLRKIKEGGLLNKQTTVRENFVILKVNNKPVKTKEELMTIVQDAKRITLSGFFPGYDGLYDYQLELQ